MSRSKVGLKTLEALEASLFCNAILESVFESFIAVAKSEVAGRCLSVHEVSVMELEVSRRHPCPHYQYNELTLSAAIFPSPNSRLSADVKHVRPRIRIRPKRGRASSFVQPFRNLGLWHSVEDLVRWDFTFDKATDFRIRVHYACHSSSAGNRMVLAVGEHLAERRFLQPGVGINIEYLN